MKRIGLGTDILKMRKTHTFANELLLLTVFISCMLPYTLVACLANPLAKLPPTIVSNLTSVPAVASTPRILMCSLLDSIFAIFDLHCII